MKQITIVILVIALNICANPQTVDSTSNNSRSQVCVIDPEIPSYPGGIDKGIKFIYDNLHDSIKAMKINAKVFIQLDIDSSGVIKQAKILRGINGSVDKDILRVFSIMPKWIPAIKDGNKVETVFVQPFIMKWNGN